MPNLVLASGSPRRSLLLSAAGYTFRVDVPDVDETPRAGEEAAEMVLRLSEAKARAVGGGVDEVVLAADTVVVLDGEIMGKPTDEADAARMLSRLAGRTHQVLTGWTLVVGDQERFGVAESHVRFRPLTDEDVHAYISDVQPLDKAGAYAIQADRGRLISSVTGSRSNVMGLPIGDIVGELDDVGVERSTPDSG